MQDNLIRHDWQKDEALRLMRQPLNDLIFQAQTVHRRYFDANCVQLSTLSNIKRGGCPEDCAYCPQSARYKTGVSNEPLMSLPAVKAAAHQAQRQGATRFCMGAAWRAPKDRDLEAVLEMIKAVKARGMETCATLGMLSSEQTHRLQQAGLDFYNHNIDSSESFYKTIIST